MQGRQLFKAGCGGLIEQVHMQADQTKKVLSQEVN
jgi:hypothetical protein